MSPSHLSDKTLDVLQAVASAGSASLPQIQAQCGLPLTTVHRIIQTLVQRNFVMRTGKGSYCLGSSSIALSRGVSLHDLLVPAARPYLQDLSKRVRNHVHLGIWQEGMVTYLVKQRYGRTRLHSTEGAMLEGYCSALGKVLLAALDEAQLDRYAADGPFVPLTRNTIVDPDRLRSQLAQIRVRGWALDDEEIALGLRCIAVPLLDEQGKVMAAISISTVMTDATPHNIQVLLPELSETADRISRKLFHGE